MMESGRNVGAEARSKDLQTGITLIELLIGMVIVSIISTMLIMGWVSLQKSYAHSIKTNNAISQARDAVSRTAREIRDAQPLVLTTPAQTPFTLANPMEVRFYSAFNNSGTRADGTGIGALRLTRIYLDTGEALPQKTLYWQRDTDNNGSFTASDRVIVLAGDVVNNSIPNTNVTPNTSYTAVFTYGYRSGSNFLTADSITSANLSKIVSVRIRLLIDDNLERPPASSNIETTVRPRNAPQQ
jgi:prepilin-type N-terminal cleavage/methylation domain-containing protein